MTPAKPLVARVARLFPPSLHTHPLEWGRAALGAAFGVLLPLLLCGALFGRELALLVLGPLGASAVLLFAVSSGALSQPWSILGSYLCATLVATAAGLWLDGLAAICVALGGTLLAMCALRCLHPPGAALALCLVQGHAGIAPLGFGVLGPVLLAAGGLLVCALLFNNLTGVRYPRTPAVQPPLVAAERVRAEITAADLQQALDEFGGFVDVTADDLEEIVRRSARHARRRSLGEAFAAR
ncbi:HPP family protein [Pseudomonas stutzeri]|nr:HPP family protein [Stutzerimonas stutzeri]